MLDDRNRQYLRCLVRRQVLLLSFASGTFVAKWLCSPTERAMTTEKNHNRRNIGNPPHSETRDITKATHRPSGAIWINNVPVPWESWLERRVLLALSVCVDVISISAQSRKLELCGGRIHWPDFVVTLDSGEQVTVDVKPLGILSKDAAKRQVLLDTAKQLLSQGQRYVVLTDDQLGCRIREDNTRILYLSRRATITPIVRNAALNLLQAGPLPMAEVVNVAGIKRSDLIALICQGRLGFDEQQSLDLDPLVSIAKRPFVPRNFNDLQIHGRFGHLLARFALASDAQDWAEVRSDLVPDRPARTRANPLTTPSNPNETSRTRTRGRPLDSPRRART
jgi:hypothetical protein